MSKRDYHAAYEIARSDLAACYSPDGILAGNHHFVDLWARDSLFASLGAIALGDHQPVRNTLSMFFRYQRADGSIPYRILRSPTSIAKYFGHPHYFSTPRPNYRSHQSGGFVPDGGLMTIILSGSYVRASGDIAFLSTQYSSLLRVADYYVRIYNAGLIHEWFLCEWADGVMKSGQTLYTNILYWKALEAMTRIASLVGDAKALNYYRKQKDTTADVIRRSFWNGTYFADWVDSTRRDYCATHANCLAILFGFSTPKESDSILHAIMSRCDAGWTLRNTDRPYPVWRIPFYSYFVGMQDYHNGCLWMQPGLTAILALRITGNTNMARQRFDRLTDKILDDGKIYEVYEKTGKPVSRLAYRSEHPFAWSSGLYLLAHHLLIEKKSAAFL